MDEGEYDFLANHPEFKETVRPHGEVFYYKESDARGLLWASERATERRVVAVLFAPRKSLMVCLPLSVANGDVYASLGLGVAGRRP